MMANHSENNPLVMIIDDDATTRMQAMGFLSQAGLQVKDACDAITALEALPIVRPDLILLDVEMPGMNGFELCKILRHKKQLRHTPILMLTGLDDKTSIDKAYEAGATDFATKPINWSLLSRRLRYMHRASLASSQLAKEQSSLATAQRIAQLGNWEYEYKTQKTVWSKQLFLILGLKNGEKTPSYSQMAK